MNVEIINVGTELLLGEIVNTNATYLQKICRDFGFDIYYQTVVGDNPERLKDSFQLAFKRGADCVITTGGLGPTTDDLTKELSADYLGLELVYNKDEALKVEKKCQYITNQLDIPENNFKQAYFPKDAYILENLRGTANGCVMSKDEKMIINLPGPPKELTHVVEHSLKPYLENFRQDTIYTYEYLTMFIGESKIDELLRDMIDHQSDISIALYAGEETVRIRLGTKAKSQSEADLKMLDTKRSIESILSPFIIRNTNLKLSLREILPPLSISYKGGFRLNEDVLDDHISSDAHLRIKVETIKKELGETVIFTFDNQERFEVPSFVSAQDSYSKIEARFVAKLYKYLLKRQN